MKGPIVHTNIKKIKINDEMSCYHGYYIDKSELCTFDLFL